MKQVILSVFLLGILGSGAAWATPDCEFTCKALKSKGAAELDPVRYDWQITTNYCKKPLICIAADPKGCGFCHKGIVGERCEGQCIDPANPPPPDDSVLQAN